MTIPSLCLVLTLLSSLAYGQAAIEFKILTKTPPFSGIAVGYAKDNKSLFLRDWENYYHYSFEANLWSKLKFSKHLVKLRKWAPRAINAYARKEYRLEFLPLSNQIPVTYLPSFSKIILFSEQLEILDTQTIELSYIKIEGGVPISTGLAVWDEKVHVFGGSILAPAASRHKPSAWNVEFSAKLITFDPANLTFQENEPMPSPALCQGALVGDSLFVFGTLAAGTSTSFVFRYVLHQNKWETLEKVPVDITTCAIASSGQNIFLLGARGVAGYLGVYSTNTHTYTEFPTNVKCKFGVACVRDNQLYYFGAIDVDYPGWIDRNMYVLDLATLQK